MWITKKDEYGPYRLKFSGRIVYPEKFVHASLHVHLSSSTISEEKTYPSPKSVIGNGPHLLERLYDIPCYIPKFDVCKIY